MPLRMRCENTNRMKEKTIRATEKADRHGPQEMGEGETKMQVNREEDRRVAQGGGYRNNKVRHNARKTTQRQRRRITLADGTSDQIPEGPPPEMQ